MLPCVPYVLEVKTTSYGKHCVFPLFVPFEVLSNDKSDSEKKAPPVIHPGTRNPFTKGGALYIFKGLFKGIPILFC